MSTWMCPDCGRPFGRVRQSHDCSPGITLEEYFSTGPAYERPIFEAVMNHLEAVGPVTIDPVSVGIFLKNPRKVAELRPRTKWVAISFSLRRTATHRTIVRKVTPYSGKYFHVANVESVDQLDDALLDLLTEAYQVALGD